MYTAALFHKSNDRIRYGTRGVIRISLRAEKAEVLESSDTKKLMVCADDNEPNRILGLVIKNGTIISGHIYTSTPGVRLMKQVIIKDWVKWIY